MASATAFWDPKNLTVSSVSMRAFYRYPYIQVNRHTDTKQEHHKCMETFGKRIKTARKSRQMNQIVLADKAGIKQPTLSDIETGETKMLEGGTLVAISQALEVRPEWVMTGKGQRDSSPKSSAIEADPMLSQLIGFYNKLGDDGKHELVEFANFKYTQERPGPSASDPYPNVPRPKAPAPGSFAKQGRAEK